MGKFSQQKGGRRIHIDEPWREQWDSRELKNDNKFKFYAAVIVSILVNSIIWPSTLLTLSDPAFQQPTLYILIVLMFPAAGLFLFGGTIWFFKYWQRYKNTSLTLDTYPGALGHPFRGILNLDEEIPKVVSFAVKLSCFRSRINNDGETHESILWQDEQTIPAAAGSYTDRYRLPVVFEIPVDQPPTRTASRRDRHDIIWRINANAKMIGHDYREEYDVPIFDPTEYDNIVPRPLAGQNQVTRIAPSFSGDWQKIGMRYGEDFRGKYYYFPPARRKSFAVKFTFGFLFLGAFALAPLYTTIPWPIVVASGFFSLVCGYFALRHWLFKTELTVSGSKLTFRRGYFKGGQSTYEADEIESIKKRIVISQGHHAYYKLEAALKSGKKLTLASFLRGSRDTEAVAKKISTELGLAV